ncbi:MAG: KTSC domain-containing protein [bacterium]|nr:KTSC domain-containing protein [bacterium]
MEREIIQSSDIRSVGYDDETSILEVEFKSGNVYQYVNVPEHVYDELMKSESKGRYFNSEIRDRYPNSKIEYN